MNNNSVVLDYLPGEISKLLRDIRDWDRVIEIRLRVNQPLQVIKLDNEAFISNTGKEVISAQEAYKVTGENMKRAFMLLCKNSLYALERQLKEGFITIPGGHRVGFTGQAIIENGSLKTINNINSLNYRITRELPGVARDIITKIYNPQHDYIYNTLIISPPLCGKTTLLRDLIRFISSGFHAIQLKGKKIGLVDERSEIGGAYNGIAQNKIGNRTDLLDNCPKAQGILLLIRSMSPEVIAVDEIGREEDVVAIKEAINAGVSILTTIHGRDFQSVQLRPAIGKLINKKVFERFIILSRRKGIGTIETVCDGEGKEVI